MNLDDELRRAAKEEPISVPRSFSNRVEDTLAQLPISSGRRGGHRRQGWRILATAAAAVLALGIYLPNTGAAMAATLGDLPLLGPLFQVVTFRTYEQEGGKNHVSISTPQIQGDGQGAEEINQQIETYTRQLVEEYESNAQADGYFNLDVTWRVVTNTENWFTLEIQSDRVMASGSHEEQHYHIYPPTGQQMTLSNLFAEGFDYVASISKELKEQMAQRMANDSREVYWLENGDTLGDYYFDQIQPEQDFYFNGEGRIVIPFDKYEVGPGSTGSPEFTLESQELYDNLLYHP